MLENERAIFTKKLQATLELYDKTPSKDSLAIWWNDLSIYPLRMVADAIRQYRTSENGKFAPKLSDILAILNRDNRLGADEAWAMIPHDENKTVVWTDEMSEALSIVNSLILSGDMIAARMAFKDAYVRLVNEARLHNKPARWSICPGFDKSLRNGPIEEALRMGRIQRDYAMSMLSHDEILSIEDLKFKVTENLRIENKSEHDIANVNKHIETLKKTANKFIASEIEPTQITPHYRQWAVKLATREHGGEKLPIILMSSWREALGFLPDITSNNAIEKIKICNFSNV